MGFEKVIYTTDEYFHWRGKYGWKFEFHGGNKSEIQKFESALRTKEPAVLYSRYTVQTDWDEVMDKSVKVEEKKEPVVTISDTLKDKKLITRLKKAVYKRMQKGK
jgi:hypothetical protein